MIKVEICANSIKDCLVAQSLGAHRIELVSASYLGGLNYEIGRASCRERV